MSHSSLKRKYLRRAQNIIGKSEQNLKLQASVEPFIHQSQHPSQPSRGQKCLAPVLARSNSDPSSHTFPPTPGQLQEGGRQNELIDSCSDSDSQSVYSYRSLPTSHPSPERVPSYSELHQRGPIAVSTREHYGGYVSPNSSPMVQRTSLDPRLYPFSSTPAPNTDTYSRTCASYNVDTQRVYSASRSDAEVERLSAQLKVQTEVNRELKRLLVASVGGDIQLHLDQIVQEKAELSRDLDASLQQLAENSEEFDRVFIDCDIWRSKFLASRLMIDELASWKAELSIQFKEVHRALNCLMKERKSLSRELTECSAYLHGAVEGLQSSVSQRSGVGVHSEEGEVVGASWQGGGGPSGRVATVTPVQYPTKGRLSRQSTNQVSGFHHATVLEIAHTLNSMAKTLNQLLSEGKMVPQVHGARNMGASGGRGAQHHSPPHEQHHHVTQPTVGERLARKVLQGKEQPMERSLPLPLRLSDEELATLRVQNRTMSSLNHSRLQSFDDNPKSHLFHCNKCKGKVLNV